MEEIDTQIRNVNMSLGMLQNMIDKLKCAIQNCDKEMEDLKFSTDNMEQLRLTSDCAQRIRGYKIENLYTKVTIYCVKLRRESERAFEKWKNIHANCDNSTKTQSLQELIKVLDNVSIKLDDALSTGQWVKLCLKKMHMFFKGRIPKKTVEVYRSRISNIDEVEIAVQAYSNACVRNGPLTLGRNELVHPFQVIYDEAKSQLKILTSDPGTPRQQRSQHIKHRRESDTELGQETKDFDMNNDSNVNEKRQCHNNELNNRNKGQVACIDACDSDEDLFHMNELEIALMNSNLDCDDENDSEMD